MQRNKVRRSILFAPLPLLAALTQASRAAAGLFRGKGRLPGRQRPTCSEENRLDKQRIGARDKPLSRRGRRTAQSISSARFRVGAGNARSSSRKSC